MGDPYGLIADESDFLIHPAKIAKGEGVRFYGGYRFTYTGMTNWDYDLDLFDPSTSAFVNNFAKETSGDEQEHEALLGAAFSLGTGRAGIFVQYEGMRSDYDGHVAIEGPWPFAESNYDLTSNRDDFLLRFLYGLPLRGIKLGGEIQFSYLHEEHTSWIYEVDLFEGAANYLNDPWWADWDLFPFMIPYDSSYGEALLKGSVEGKTGPIDIEFTLRGGFIFWGDNELEYGEQSPVGSPILGYDLDGDVDGWRIGGDLWVRYARAEDLFLPFLVRIDYQAKTRDGDGQGLLGLAGEQFDYEHHERNLQIEVGGGIEKEFGKGIRVAAGIYYNYLQGTNDLRLMQYEAGGDWQKFDYSDLPGRTAHRVIVRLADEHQFTPAVVLRGGINLFFGWVREECEAGYESNTGSSPINDISLNGPHWGIGVSVGGTVKLSQFTVEPFVNAGYQELRLHGNGEGVATSTVPILYLWEMDKTWRAWYVGGGLSVLFDLP
jgi:hypothetical protein